MAAAIIQMHGSNANLCKCSSRRQKYGVTHALHCDELHQYCTRTRICENLPEGQLETTTLTFSSSSVSSSSSSSSSLLSPESSVPLLLPSLLSPSSPELLPLSLPSDEPLPLPDPLSPSESESEPEPNSSSLPSSLLLSPGL